MMKERLLGNKEKFAIQYEVTGAINQFLYGKMCYWIQGRQFGKYEEIILSDTLSSITTIVKDNGNRMHENFFILDMKEVFHLLSGAAFWEDNGEIEKRANEEQWARFNISIDVGTLVHVFAFLIDSNENARLIFTDNTKKCFQTYVERGYIDTLFLQLYNELNLIYDEKCC